MLNYQQFIAQPHRPCAVVAHRGGWSAAPENSLAALEAARRQGAAIIECDVRRSADGVLYIHHDDDLDRMTGLGRAIEELSAEEIDALHLRERDGGSSRPFTGQHVPRLNQFLARAHGLGAYLDLDVKDRALLEEVARAAAQANATEIVNVKLALDSDAAADRLATIRDEIGVAVMAMATFPTEGDEALAARLQRLRPFMVEASAPDLQTLANVTAWLRSLGAAVWVNTLDLAVGCADCSDSRALRKPQAVWGALLEAGVGAIQTDHPHELASYIAKRKWSFGPMNLFSLRAWRF